MKVRTRILVAILCGLIASLYYVQYDARLIAAAEKKIQCFFENMFACGLHYTLKTIQVVPLVLRAENVTVSSGEKKTWYWQAQSVDFNSSLLQAVLHRRIGLDIVLKDVTAYSGFQDGTLAIADHLKKLIFEVQDLPVFLRSLMIRKGCFVWSDQAKTIEGSLLFSSESTTSPDQLKISLFITDGSLSIWKIPFIQALTAQIHVKKSMSPSSETTMIQAEGQCTLGFLSPDQHDCSVTVFLNDSSGSICLHNKTNSFSITGTFNNEKHGIDIQGHIDLACIDFEGLKIFGNLPLDLCGTCSFSLHIDTSLTDWGIQGTLAIDNCICNGYPLGSFKSSMHKHNSLYTGTCTGSLAALGILNATMTWDAQRASGVVTCSNDSTIATWVPYWNILPKNFNAHYCWDGSGAGSGTWHIGATHDKVETRCETKGTVSFDKHSIISAGTMDSYLFDVRVDVSPQYRLDHLIIRDKKTDHVIFASSHYDHHWIQGDIHYNFLRPLLEHLLGVQIKGEGILHVEGGIKDGVVQCTMNMSNAHVQVPHMYNIVHDFHATISVDPFTKKLVARDIQVAFHKGMLKSRRATVWWLDDQGLYIHVPLVVEKMFINKEKDSCAEISGALLLTKRGDDQPMCKGTITIDRGQSKKNIFSSPTLTPRLYNLGCDLVIKTREPFKIQTSFLKTEVILSVLLKNNVSDPHVSGTISLSSGSLKFPYRDLYITRGSLYFLPNQVDDPAIELIAKGTIKNYQITMIVGGSLKNPHISFESVPSLNEEQIITLLLAGSQEGSLALVMPTLAMQNVQALFFDPEQTSLKLEHYFKNILSPLKRIRIMPSFVDQTGRGGFRGAIEVDASDQLHALIQKNFSLPEDTKFELEYLLSDEVSVRGIKDERGDLGGEVEMRWKF